MRKVVFALALAFTIFVSFPSWALDAPGNFRVTDSSSDSITWAWDDVAGEEGYEILDNVTQTAVIINIPVDTLTTIETGLLPNTTYSRQVRAYNYTITSTSVENCAALFTTTTFDGTRQNGAMYGGVHPSNWIARGYAKFGLENLSHVTDVTNVRLFAYCWDYDADVDSNFRKISIDPLTSTGPDLVNDYVGSTVFLLNSSNIGHTGGAKVVDLYAAAEVWVENAISSGADCCSLGMGHEGALAIDNWMSLLNWDFATVEWQPRLEVTYADPYSDNSNMVSACTLAAVPILTNSALTFTFRNSNSITVRVFLNGNPVGTVVELEGAIDVDGVPGAWASQGLKNSGYTWELGGLNPHQSYWFRARAQNWSGIWSAYSPNAFETTRWRNIYVNDAGGNDSAGNGSLGAPYKTIQKAVDVSDAYGCRIFVADGTYTGVSNRNINFTGRVIELKSVNGAANCILDAQALGQLFLFANGETNEALVEGFTVRNGYAAGADGGAVSCVAASPVFRDCVFDNNTADGSGGACSFKNNCAPVLEGCMLSNNSAVVYGGGVYCANNARASIDVCTIVVNTAASGGGIFCDQSNASVYLCQIGYNQVTSDGGGIVFSNSGAVVALSAIAYNTAIGGSSGGGGVYCYGEPAAVIIGCMIANNSVTDGGGVGGGIVINESDIYMQGCTIAKNFSAGSGGGFTVTGDVASSMTNMIIWANYAVSGGEQFYLDTGTFVSMSYCNYENNSAGDIQGPGGISPDAFCDTKDPQFIDATNLDFRLLYSSPAVNAGCNSYVPPELLIDLDGLPRIMAKVVDMGCYETDPPPLPPDGLRINGIVNPVSLGNDTAYFSAVYRDEGPWNYANEMIMEFDDDPGFATPIGDTGWFGIFPTARDKRCQAVPIDLSALARGVTYYWRVKFKNSLLQEGAWSTEPAGFVRSLYYQTFGDEGYYLLNISCYTGTRTIGDLLKDDLGIIWIFKYDEANREWIQVFGHETFENNVGYFIWNDRPNGAVGFSGDNVSAEASNFKIDLVCSNPGDLENYGWNLIRNPYSHDISWSSCDLQNCKTTHWYPWTGTEYLLWDSAVNDGCGSDIIPAGASFWVQANGSNSSVTIYRPGGAPHPLPPPALHWYIRFTAQSGPLLDTQTYIGAREGASNAHDQYDIMKIRSYAIDYIRPFFSHRDWGRNSGPYAFDIQPFPVGGEILTWKMTVYATNAAGKIELFWDVPEELRGGWEFRLLDEASGVTRDLTEHETYDYTASGQDTRQFMLTAKQIEAMLLGDSDLDGTVTEDDAVVCSRAGHGLLSLTPRQLYVSDLTSDGDVDILDALLILRRLRGHLPTNP